MEEAFSETTEETHRHYCHICGGVWSHEDDACVGPRFESYYYGDTYACPICLEG